MLSTKDCQYRDLSTKLISMVYMLCLNYLLPYSRDPLVSFNKGHRVYLAPTELCGISARFLLESEKESLYYSAKCSADTYQYSRPVTEEKS